MSDAPNAADNLVLAETEKSRMKDNLVEMRQQIMESKASGTALIVGIIVFLLLGKIGLTLAGVVAVVAGGIVYFAKKASLKKMLLDSIASYDDEKLRYWHTQASLEVLAAHKRSSIIRGTLVFVGVVLLIVWIVARTQR